jgi:hypothetical protein
MRSEQARGELERRLREAGVDVANPRWDDVGRALAAWQRFALDVRFEDVPPPEHDGDMLLVQWGTYDWGGGEAFELDFTRQFSFEDDDGEYEGMQQLSCTFRFPPTNELRAIGEWNQWGSPEDADAIVTGVEATPGFRRLAQLQPEPSELELVQDDV